MKKVRMCMLVEDAPVVTDLVTDIISEFRVEFNCGCRREVLLRNSPLRSLSSQSFVQNSHVDGVAVGCCWGIHR